MERLLEASKNQSWLYLFLKVAVTGLCTAALYLEVFSDTFTPTRSYHIPWQCFSKAAFKRPNPYFGDVNVSQEFTSLIDFSFILMAACTATALLSAILKLCTTAARQVMFFVDGVLIVCYVTWLLLATVGRFSHTGRVCSGAY